MSDDRLFVFVNDTAREGAIQLVKTAPEGWQCVVGPRKRSLPQNALFHALCGEAEKSALFMGRKLSLGQWKMLFVSGHQIATGGKADMRPGLENEFVNLYESTSAMNRKRKSSLIDYTIAWLENEGIDTRRARGYAEHEMESAA